MKHTKHTTIGTRFGVAHSGLVLSLAVSLTTSLTACGLPNSADASAIASSSLDHALGLTAEQRLQDYTYLWDTLRSSYLCFGIHDRNNPAHTVDEIYENYREMVVENDSDEKFYSALYSALWLLDGYGHLSILEPELYTEMRDTAQTFLSDRESYAPWLVRLTDDKTQQSYERLSAFLTAFYAEEEQDSGQNKNPDGESGQADAETVTETPNLHTLILPGGAIAYVKIDGFPADYAADQAALFAFYERAAGCTDLIIDLTENPGGSELYWEELIVAPHIEQPLSCENYALLAKTEQTLPYIQAALADTELYPIAELPTLPQFRKEGTEAATHFIKSRLAVEPSAYRSPFHGRIWLLVDESVYSASESLSIFAQQTGFATLVGSQTGGDGIGATDPILVSLPNSGILICYTMLYGLNPDGSSNEEVGTTPDVLSKPGESPLVTVLAQIAASPR